MKKSYNLNLTYLVIFFLMVGGNVFSQTGRILISEFMAVNSNSIVDEDAVHSDWIEIYNNTDSTINLGGWALTDKADNLLKWKFPAKELQAGKYLVIFASEKNRVNPAANLHTDFKLSGSGEYLAIVEPDGTVSHHYSPAFVAQRQDVSYGIYHNQEVFFSTPTPGAENVASNIPFAPVFSQTRGFYETPIDVVLTIPGGQGTIYYTTNGTRPTKTNATLYTAPVRITTTTPLSAVVFNAENVSSDVVSHSYIYLKDVVKQSKTPAGYPTTWTTNTSGAIPTASDYEMDARVTEAAAYKDRMESSLKSLPTMNIVTNVDYLFNLNENTTTGGIYVFTGLPHTVSKTWERPTSVEYFDPATGQEFQLNCRLKLHGGNSRRPSNSPKHGFELGFRAAYGPSKLNFDIFNEKQSAKEFNSLILRAGYNYTWVKNAAAQQIPAQYIQDSWAKTTQLDMGQPAAHEKFVHLYLNGLYWGVYNISEELNKDYMESYLGGTEDDYDVIKEKETAATGITDGNFVAWDNFKSQITGVATSSNYLKMQGRNADGTVNATYPVLLDVDNYIDYMLINYYIGNGDWDANNWTVGRNRITNQHGFQFFCWDAETSMTLLTENKIITGSAGNPAAFMQYLKKNNDFKVRIADRIQKHLLNAGGALTPAVIAERYEKLADEIELSMISESARWSDWYAPYNPYTLNDHWLPRKNDLMTNYFPQRTGVLLTQLKTASLFPSINAPVLSHPTGTYNKSFNVSITGSGGTIYYTTDGTDPRLEIANTVSNNALSYSAALAVSADMTVKARVKSSTEWSAIAEAAYKIDPFNAVHTLLDNALQCSNYPNPFTGSTRIRFDLPTAGDVRVSVYYLDGRLADELFDGFAYSGNNELDWSPVNLPAGMYLCRISYQGTNTVLKISKK